MRELSNTSVNVVYVSDVTFFDILIVLETPSKSVAVLCKGKQFSLLIGSNDSVIFKW